MTTYFRVDGFSAIRHNEETRKIFREIKNKYPTRTKSDIVRDAVVKYAERYGYDGNSAKNAMNFIKDTIAEILDDAGFGDVVIISSTNVIKEALRYLFIQEMH